MEPLTFDSSDVGLIEATVSKLYSKLDIGAVGSCTRAQITRRVIAPGLGFDDLDYSLPYTGVAHATRLRFTVLDPVICARVTATREDATPVTVTGHRPVSRQAALRLKRTIGYVRDTLMAAPEAERAPLVVSTASELLAVSVLQAFPNSAVTGTTAQDQHDASPGTLRRAVAFIEANPGIDVSISDIACAACVTPRAVQLAFRRHLDTTPLAYLRQVRLHHAHQDLAQASRGDGTTVTTVAYRWGFTSPSRFAATYRAVYGVLPSDTLSA